jgi:hypothetical protein
MRSENAIMPSRREFLSDALGIGLVTTSTCSVRDGEARSMSGQSDKGAANSGRAIKNTSLTWEVFLAPSTPARTPCRFARVYASSVWIVHSLTIATSVLI